MPKVKKPKPTLAEASSKLPTKALPKVTKALPKVTAWDSAPGDHSPKGETLPGWDDDVAQQSSKVHVKVGKLLKRGGPFTQLERLVIAKLALVDIAARAPRSELKDIANAALRIVAA